MADPITIPREFSITPVRTHGKFGESIQIDAAGDFTLTEAMEFALSIIHTVQDYGKVKVEAK